MDNESTDTTPTAEAVLPAPVPVPAELWIDELHAETIQELMHRAEPVGVRWNADKTRHHLVFDILRAYASRGTVLFADGIIEATPQGGGFLRWPRYNFRALPQDVFLAPNFERNHFLRNGNQVTARIRMPRDRERYISVEEILTI